VAYVNCKTYDFDISPHETPESHVTRNVLKLKYGHLEKPIKFSEDQPPLAPNINCKGVWTG